MAAFRRPPLTTESLLDRLLHHTLDVGGFGVGVRFAIYRMLGGKLPFEPFVSPGFLWMGAQIVPERQALPHLSIRLGNMHMMGALCQREACP